MIFAILIFLVPIIGIIVGIIKGWDFFEKIGCAFGLGFLGFIAVLLIGLPLAFNLPKTIEYENVELVTLQDGSSQRGSFFLGSGFIDGVQKYTYYSKSGDAFQLRSVDAEDVLVFQDTKNPYVRHEKSCTSPRDWLIECAIDTDRVTEIHVPKNSIKADFVLDAK